jgi:membrane-associated phospholipid phosphatase
MRERRAWQRVVLLAIVLCVATGARAQTIPANAQPDAQPSPTPQASSTPSLEKEFFKNILRDQRAFIRAPFHITRSDTRFLLPLGAATAALIATDRSTAAEMVENGDHPTRLRISRDISYLGEGYTTGGIAAAFYFVGRATHNARARETGLLAGEALIDNGIDVMALKTITHRQRPTVDNGQAEFFDEERGDSFPSGHASNAWALATIISEEYHDRPLIRVTAYGLATAVSIARYTGRNHFLSDVLVGSALGYGIGHYVYKTHHDPNLDAAGGTSAPRKRSKLFPLISPEYSGRARLYGATFRWNL